MEEILIAYINIDKKFIYYTLNIIKEVKMKFLTYWSL